MTTGLKSLLMAGLLANAALSAHAQTPTPPAAPKPMASASSPRMHQGHMESAKMDDMVAKHLAELKTKLKITAAQEGSWTTFTTAMKPPARSDMSSPDRAEMDKLTTPERIDKMRALRAQHTKDRQANMEQRENAIKAFYTDLNADQKKTFDTEHSKMMHRWGDHKAHGPRHEALSTPAKP